MSNNQTAMTPAEALKLLGKYQPCAHDSITLLGDGKTWAKCEDCGATVAISDLENAINGVKKFTEAFDILYDLIKSTKTNVPTIQGRGRTKRVEVIGYGEDQLKATLGLVDQTVKGYRVVENMLFLYSRADKDTVPIARALSMQDMCEHILEWLRSEHVFLRFKASLAENKVSDTLEGWCFGTRDSIATTMQGVKVGKHCIACVYAYPLKAVG